MGRSIDLTGKLGLGGKPTIRIKDTVLTVNDSAKNMLLIMQEVGDELSIAGAFKVADLLFDRKSAKALDDLGLNLDDFMTVVENALDLVTGGSAGEAGTPDTTL